MGKKMKELRAAVRSAREEMEKYADMPDKATEFAKAERSYKKASAEYQEAILEEQERNAGQKEYTKEQRNADLHKLVDEVKRGGQKEFVLKRSAAGGVITSGTDLVAAAAIPVTVQDLLGVLEMKTIYDKVGIKIQTGVKGNIVWPVVNSIGSVTVAGENVKVGTAAIDFGKVTAVQRRLGISFEASNEAVNDASFDLYGFVVDQLHNRLAHALNTAAISATGLGQLTGPFAGTSEKRTAVAFAGKVPTYVELLQMKGKVAAKGVDMVGFCYVVTPEMYSILEATPITAGDSRMIINNGTIAGYPVFQSNDVAADKVAAGCFGYAALNQHGDMSLVIDPYTGAQNGTVKFVLNSDWSLTTLRYEAFAVGTCKTA